MLPYKKGVGRSSRPAPTDSSTPLIPPGNLAVVGRRRTLTPEAEWHKILTEGHRSFRIGRAIYGRVPSAPRCKVCQNPFGGLGGRMFRMIGQGPSRKNPNMCASCCE